MEKLIQFIKNNFLQFLKFGVVGLSNTLVSYGVYYVCVRFFDIHYIAANIIAFIIAVLNSFYWNKKFVFKGLSGKKEHFKALLKLYITNVFTGVFLSNALLFIEVELLGIDKYIAPLINIAAIMPVNYLISKYWAFNKTGGSGT
ncbi:sugar translocase [Spirochaetia bacterium]|nr:sugar translocase [Spirochaetia bacterium]